MAIKCRQLVWSQFCVARAVCAGAPSCWKNVSIRQQSSAVVDKTGKETANVVRRIHFSALVNKVELSLATKTHAIRDHYMLRKLLMLSEKTFLPPAQTLLFWLRIIVYEHYVIDDVINGKLVTGYFESLKEF